MGKGLEQTFLQRQMGQPDHEKMLDITNHQGNANRNPIEILLHSHQNGYCQKKKKKKAARGEEVEKLNSLCTVWGNI